MTDQQHPGGVAGRVIRDMEQQRGRFESEQEHIAAVRAGGMWMLYTELSREARAILTELETHRDRQQHPDFYAVATDLLRNTRSFFTRLGLDLESEDE